MTSVPALGKIITKSTKAMFEKAKASGKRGHLNTPHGQRFNGYIHNGQLFFLNSATGNFCKIDL